MARDDEYLPRGNRDKKVEGRAKRRKYLQGTRSYLHALTNSVARRGAPVDKTDKSDRK